MNSAFDTQRYIESSIAIPGGEALRGTERAFYPQDGEAPLKRADIAPFHLSPNSVDNSMFAAFVNETGHVTEAEQFGWSYVFFKSVASQKSLRANVAEVPWWCAVDGADWRHPEGPGSQIKGRARYPVVHVSWNDAVACAAWAGGRLPSEAEWEHAARGGLSDVIYPWGNDEPKGNQCNIGFPKEKFFKNKSGTVPTNRYQPNGYGVFNSVGNVWEWTNERPDSFLGGSKTDGAVGSRILKGGSFMCHRDTCYRYRIAARISNTEDSSAQHTGFRVVFDM